MPIVYHQFGVPGAAAQPGHAIARELARQCAVQLQHQLLAGPGGGIATGSCWAAVAAAPNPVAGFPGLAPVGGGAPLVFTAAFGQSQMANIANNVIVPGAPPGGFGTHAERNALLVAAGNGLAPGNPGVAFVQLQPCGGCQAWLANPAQNPFPAYAGPGQTLDVWYRWPYPAGVANMVAWNGAGIANQLADINANW